MQRAKTSYFCLSRPMAAWGIRMKKRWQTVLSVLLYIFIVACALDFNIFLLIDLRLIFLTLVGTLLLTLPYYEGKISRRELLYILAENPLIQVLYRLFCCSLPDFKTRQATAVCSAISPCVSARCYMASACFSFWQNGWRRRAQKTLTALDCLGCKRIQQIWIPYRLPKTRLPHRSILPRRK